MDRRTRNVFVIGLLALVAAVGGTIVLLGGSPAEPGGSANAPSVVGVIVGVESESLVRVRSITLRTMDGATEDFTVGVLENAADLPPGHLAEHQASGEPVRVWYRTEGGVNIAIRIDDAT